MAGICSLRQPGANQDSSQHLRCQHFLRAHTAWVRTVLSANSWVARHAWHRCAYGRTVRCVSAGACLHKWARIRRWSPASRPYFLKVETRCRLVTVLAQTSRFVIMFHLDRPSPTACLHRPSPTACRHRPSPTACLHRPSPTACLHRPSPTACLHRPSPTACLHRPSPTACLS